MDKKRGIFSIFVALFCLANLAIRAGDLAITEQNHVTQADILFMDRLHDVCSTASSDDARDERDALLCSVAKALRKNGTSAFACACAAGHCSIAHLIHHLTTVIDVEIQQGLVEAAHNKHTSVVQYIIGRWGPAEDSFLGWAREEALEQAITNKDVPTALSVLAGSYQTPLQFQILEPEINAAFNQPASKKIAHHILELCTSEQRKMLVTLAAKEKHYALCQYIVKTYFQAKPASADLPSLIDEHEMPTLEADDCPGTQKIFEIRSWMPSLIASIGKGLMFVL